MNALSDAFPDERTGTVSVRFTREAEGSACGSPMTASGRRWDRPANGSGLGQLLVRSMVTQLEGSYAIEPDAGTPATGGDGRGFRRQADAQTRKGRGCPGRRDAPAFRHLAVGVLRGDQHSFFLPSSSSADGVLFVHGRRRAADAAGRGRAAVLDDDVGGGWGRRWRRRPRHRRRRRRPRPRVRRPPRRRRLRRWRRPRRPGRSRGQASEGRRGPRPRPGPGSSCAWSRS